MKLFHCTVTLALLLTQAPAQAQTEVEILNSVSGLVSECKTYIQSADSKAGETSPESALNAGLCMGYISGYAEMNSIHSGYSKTKMYCPPSIIQYDNLIRVFLAWAEKHPESLSKPRYIGLTLAMRDAYPCIKKS